MRADLRNGKAEGPAQFMLGFLLYDYKPFGKGASVACLWEAEEVRELRVDKSNSVHAITDMCLSLSALGSHPPDPSKAAAEHHRRILAGQKPPRHRHRTAALYCVIGAACARPTIQVAQI